MNLSNLSTGRRLELAFGFLIALLATLTVIGVNRVHRIEAGLVDINEVNSVRQRYTINFRGSVHDRAIELRDVALSDDEAEVAQAASRINQLAGDYLQSAGPLDALLAQAATPDARELEIVGEIKAIEASTLPLIKQIRELRAGRREQGAGGVTSAPVRNSATVCTRCAACCSSARVEADASSSAPSRARGRKGGLTGLRSRRPGGRCPCAAGVPPLVDVKERPGRRHWNEHCRGSVVTPSSDPASARSVRVRCARGDAASRGLQGVPDSGARPGSSLSTSSSRPRPAVRRSCWSCLRGSPSRLSAWSAGGPWSWS
ncbi:MAG: MCP four helix bundle domain-containing protein [Pseudomonadota bacterium]|nr:MCP four helix bundle domain-containing protein [Pseudomonadota bacterium]